MLNDAIHRADLPTLRIIIMTDAFSAFIRINDVDFRPEKNRLVRALRHTHVAVDAICGDEQGHDRSVGHQLELCLQPFFD